MHKVSVHLLVICANQLMLTVNVCHAIKDIISSTELANCQPPTLLLLQTLAAEPGIGTIKSASLAPNNGSSSTEPVFPLATSVLLTMLMEPAPHALKATTSTMVSVKFQLLTELNLLILDVPHGTGIIKFAYNAQEDGISTQTMFVFLLTTTAMNGIHLHLLALAAILATFSQVDNVFVTILFVDQLIQLEDVLRATLATSFSTILVRKLVTLLASTSTMPSVALRN